ncbi:PREDICTED: uncharacterized protein LOC105556281 [Vollenhovia emeryi]|uniref:uncharacterized protein LOC105556281 n=1 Tax=Vollenhovia emeryi TaxID=411798 RepID=UPI0005F4CA4E|nr:PREDICTED: uncharacterized protein LOC105556281 [Vollenhovia emeryi]
MLRKRKADIEYLQRKLRKLQRKMETIQAESDSSSSTEEERLEEDQQVEDPKNDPGQEIVELEEGEERQQDENKAPNSVENEEAIDENILEMLGEDPQKSKALDITLHESIKLQWNYWIAHGLDKKVKDELTEKYARSTEFDAPKLNAEISAILTEQAIKRDRYMLENQKLAGSALTAIGSTLTMIMAEQDVDKLTFVQRLNEAAKLIIQIHHNQSVSRKAFIYPGVKKQFQSMLKETKPANFLFGNNLAEKIKDSKNIEKLSQNVKNQTAPRATTQYQGPKQTLNWKSLQGRRPLTNRAGYTNTQGRNRPRLTFKTKEPLNSRAQTHRSSRSSGHRHHDRDK